jgi:hypothetical protein
MPSTYHIRIKKEYATAIIEDLQKKDAVEILPEEKIFDVPQWQKDEVLKRKKYYKEHPEELISWEDAEKMLHTDVRAGKLHQNQIEIVKRY